MSTTAPESLQDAATIGTLPVDLGPSGEFATFTLFLKLPTEIRLMIWQAALPGPRIIEALYDFEWADDGESCKNKLIRTNQPPPPTLHICRESRKEALKRYIQVGKIGQGEDELDFCYALIDPLKDTLFFPWVNHDRWDIIFRLQYSFIGGDLYTQEFKNKLQYLAIDAEVWIEHSHCDYLTYFRNLKELTIVCHATGSTLEHEQWRMKSPEIEFHEPNAEALDDMRDHKDAFEERKKGFGEMSKWWQRNGHLLSVKFMIMSRGGKMCCFEPEELSSAETEISIEINADDS
jgi:hypothetical protein